MSSSTLNDSTYSSTSEGEETDRETDPNTLLGTWLGQLQQMEQGLDNIPPGHKLRLSNKLTVPTPRMDTYRFSMANMEDSQDTELDAILGELCALEDKLDREIMPKSQSAHQALGWGKFPHNHSKYPGESKVNLGHSRSNSGGTRPKFEIGGLQVDLYSDEKSDRTESPDNDSAFSDNVSMLSSESSASSGGVRGEGRSMSSQSSCMSLASSPTQVEQAARLKAEKIKIALEKMKEASIKKLFIKAFSADNSAKSLLIDERMTVGHICKLLAEKNHVPMDPKWALVEQIQELYIERVYEDHEQVVENLLHWTRDSCNRLFFLERKEKYDLFLNPQNYLLGGSSSEKNADLDDDAKNALLDEFFTSNVGVTEVEGHLYLKSEGKKTWKKHFFILRASGLYYCPKGKSKMSRDLLCLTTFDMNNVYLGCGWKKKYKSPTEYGFAIKHPQIQTKSSKYIKYLCAEDEKSLKQWVMGIRIAKYGAHLKENYDNLLRDIAEEDLETLANARSFSIPSVAKQQPLKYDDDPPTTLEKLHKLRVISRQDSIKSSKSNTSGSSGCPSERSSGTPTTDPLVFETDFPMGTIKRKPSMTPKIPLTSTTRNLAKQSGDEVDKLSIDSGNSLNGSLGRSTCGRFSLRRSKTDDRISFGSLARRSPRHCSQDTPPSTFLHEDLPPPPPELTDLSDCINFDTLPPPPPEAFRNGTLESHPPPPLSPTDWLTTALPPPPCLQNESPKKPSPPPKPRKGVRRRQSESDARSTPQRLSEHRLIVIKPRQKDLDSSCDENDTPVQKCSRTASGEDVPPRRVSSRNRRTSAPCVTDGQLQIYSEPFQPSDRKSRSQFKPSPPKRSENTRLSAPCTAPPRRSASAPYDQEERPPESFLLNLQKVMVKKWKVAQQLSSDPPSHPVLGFRDPNLLKSSPQDRKHRSSSHSREVRKNPPPPPPKKKDFKA